MLDRLLSIKIVELIIIIQSNDNKSMNSIKYKQLIEIKINDKTKIDQLIVDKYEIIIIIII